MKLIVLLALVVALLPLAIRLIGEGLLWCERRLTRVPTPPQEGE